MTRITRYVHFDPRAVESPGDGFPTYEDLVAENARLRMALEPFANAVTVIHADGRVECDASQLCMMDWARAHMLMNGDGL